MSHRPSTRLPIVARAAIVSIATVMAACSPGAGPASAPPGSQAAPSTAPTGPATATPAPAVTRRFVFDAAPVVDTELLGTNDLYVNPGALIEADGVLHLFPNSFSTWPAKVKVPHLTSTDGVEWTLDAAAGIVLDGADIALAKPGIDVSTGFLADDGTWVLIFGTVSPSAPWQLYRATAPEPKGPWTIDDEPIVTGGAAGSFDTGGVQWPWVARVGDRWALYYAGFDVPQGGSGAIGVAWSDDGVTWEKQAEPVLVPSERWEGRSLDRPRVAATPDGLVMVYAGRDLTDRGLATSTDGTTWTRVPGPSIEQADFPIRARAWDSAITYRNGMLEYFLEIGFETTRVYRATLDWP
jgi:hypothetical protein